MASQQKSLKNVVKAWSDVDFGAGLHFQERAFFDSLLNVARQSAAILEIGTGDGRMVKVLRACGVDAAFFGIDITKNLGKAPVTPAFGDARALPFAECSFDLVYSLGVVEHFPETGVAITEHARVLRKGGYALITTPHLSTRTIRRWAGYIRGREFFLGSFEEVRGRNLTLPAMRRYVERADLRIVALSGAGIVPGGSFARRILKTIAPGLWQPYLYCMAKK